MCGCMGKNAVWLVVGDNGDESRHVSVSKGVIGVIVRWALQLLSVTVRGGGGVPRRSGVITLCGC